MSRYAKMARPVASKRSAGHSPTMEAPIGEPGGAQTSPSVAGRAAIVALDPHPHDLGPVAAEGDERPRRRLGEEDEARVVEAGAGSGALSCSLLRAIGPNGQLVSFERREEFADVARKNVEQFFAGPHPAWSLTVGDLVEELPKLEDHSVDRVVLDMLAPWECVDVVGKALRPGGLVVAYVATTTQLSKVTETLRAHGEFTEPHPWETLVREWHVEGLAVRPEHRMSGHTGFLVTSRRMAPGERAPIKKRRPAPGAYGEDYLGPRPADVPTA